MSDEGEQGRRFTRRELKRGILEHLARVERAGVTAALHRANLVGIHPGEGELEAQWGVRFSLEERQTAAECWDELVVDRLLAPTMQELDTQGSRARLSDAGRRVLETGYFDRLDEALAGIDPELVETREGAWAALSRGGPDGPRHAAQSARELVDQTLRKGAPEASTRRERARTILRARRGRGSESSEELAEAACELALAAGKLASLAHGPRPASWEAEDAVRAAEIALRQILLDPDEGETRA